MATIRQTIDQLEDEMGIPIVLLTAWDTSTKTYMDFRLRDLGVLGIAQVVAWLNARLSS